MAAVTRRRPPAEHAAGTRQAVPRLARRSRSRAGVAERGARGRSGRPRSLVRPQRRARGRQDAAARGDRRDGRRARRHGGLGPLLGARGGAALLAVGAGARRPVAAGRGRGRHCRRRRPGGADRPPGAHPALSSRRRAGGLAAAVEASAASAAPEAGLERFILLDAIATFLRRVATVVRSCCCWTTCTPRSCPHCCCSSSSPASCPVPRCSSSQRTVRPRRSAPMRSAPASVSWRG